MMPIMRWDPFRELDRVNRLFSDTNLRWSGEGPVGSWVPPVDIYESGDDLVFRAEVPGMSRDDIDVSVENGTLTLKGEKKWDTAVAERDAYRIERAYGTFTRSFTLPSKVNASKIKAIYKDGVLEITLPKAEEAKPKRIEVSSN